MKDAIYLVLDMMNDLVHADGVNGKAAYGEQVRTRHVLENTRRALDKARAAGVQCPGQHHYRGRYHGSGAGLHETSSIGSWVVVLVITVCSSWPR